MREEPPRCTVCGKPVFPTAPTMFRTARYTTHPRCIRVPKAPRIPRQGHAAVSQPEAEPDIQAARRHPPRNARDAMAYLGALLTDAQVLVLSQREGAGEALRRFFRTLGAVALPGANAEQALGLLQTLRFELIVGDASQLVFNDRSFIRQIREQAGRRAPLVLGIGVTPADRTIAESDEFDGFLPRPVGYRELAAVLWAAADRHRDWVERQRSRLRRRSEALREEAARHRADAEVNRLGAQAAITRAEKLVARASGSTSPFTVPNSQTVGPRYRPELLGD
jgi:DNA-binding response OmpR family regulator